MEEMQYNYITGEIIDCLVKESSVIEGDDPKERLKKAEMYLEEIFEITGTSMKQPDTSGLRNVLTMIAAREIKTGKDLTTIRESLKRISELL